MSGTFWQFMAEFFYFFFKKTKQKRISVQYSCMKNKCFLGMLILSVLMSACGNGPGRSGYRPIMPVLPGHWQEVMGEPHWRLQWIGEDGGWEAWEGSPGVEPPLLSPVAEWTTPILAWPFWPETGLEPGIMRPSGALFPWDARGGDLSLSWEGGVHAVFWKELANAERAGEASLGRLPWYFDWRRFRQLLESGDIPDEVRGDPWLADWKEIAGRTVESGFDRRRIVSRHLTEVAIPGLEGSWVGASPFTPPLDAPPGGPLLLLAGAAPDTWVSSTGVLRCSTSGWILRKR